MAAVEQYALLGLARARAGWFREVARWTTSAAIPAEFVKCISAEEVRAHLASARPFSAVLLDGGLPAVDRDLLAAVREAGCAPLVVTDGREARDWSALGAAAVLPANLERRHLLDALATHAAMIGAADSVPGAEPVPGSMPAPWEGSVVAVCGAGGVGTSTVAIALAQGLAADARTGGDVLLADFCLHAEQAMLHDVGDVFPGVQELVELHRGRQPSAEEIGAGTFVVVERGYSLLIGLRRARYWSTIRPRAFDAGMGGLRRAFRMVVCDVDADLEAEDDGGSIDVEERCHMARTAVRQSELVLAVGRPGLKGLHALVRVLGELAGAGVPPDRLVPVLNGVPRTPRVRAGLAAALADLAAPVVGGELASPVFLPRRKVDEALRDGVPLPPPLAPSLAGAVHGSLGRRRAAPPDATKRVRPGSLGTWYEEEAG